MMTITTPNGVKCTYDDTLKVGDIISTYYKGYFRLRDIEPRTNIAPLFTFEQIAKADGTLCKGRIITKVCDASFCRRASETLQDEIDKRAVEIANLRYLQTID